MKIYAPNVHLFAYQLRQTTNSNGAETDNLTPLLDGGKAIVKAFGIDTQIPTRDRPGYRVDLLAENLKNDAIVHFEKEPDADFTGIAYPVRIHDTYALALNIRRPERDLQDNKTELVEPTFFKQLNPQHCWHNIRPSIGKTLLLTAWYDPRNKWPFGQFQGKQDNFRDLADRCLKSFQGKDPLPPFYQSGELFGSPIYEYGIPGDANSNTQILVWIFRTSETDRQLQAHYPNLVDILCYRHKIAKSYNKSRSLYKVCFHESRKLKETFDRVEKNLDRGLKADSEEIKTWLKNFPRIAFEYDRFLQDLTNQLLTIQINSQNYKRELQSLQSQLPDRNLSILEAFLESDRLFQEQIRSDLGYLQQRAKLLDRAVETIRSIVEIEQQESLQKLNHNDRDLQNTIAIVGVGLSFAAVGATVSPYLIKEEPDRPLIPLDLSALNSVHPLIFALLFSGFCGLVGAIVTKLIQEFQDKCDP